MYKYKINEKMDLMTYYEYKYAIRELPKQLGIAFNTFHNYRKLKIDDQKDIPYGTVVKLERFLGLSHGELTNVKDETKSIREQMKNLQIF